MVSSWMKLCWKHLPAFHGAVHDFRVRLGQTPGPRSSPAALHTSPGVGGHEGDGDSARAMAVNHQHSPTLSGSGCPSCASVAAGYRLPAASVVKGARLGLQMMGSTWNQEGSVPKSSLSSQGHGPLRATNDWKWPVPKAFPAFPWGHSLGQKLL